MRSILTALVLAVTAAQSVVYAQQTSGLYIGLGTGITDLQDQNITSISTGVGPLGPSRIRTNGASLRANTGIAVIGSVGYGLGNGIRVELEGGYRNNQLHRFMGDPTRNPGDLHGSNQTGSVMLSGYYDVDINRFLGIDWILPYVGAGLGFASQSIHNLRITSLNLAQPYTVKVDDSQPRLAFQAVLGAAFPLPIAPGLSLALEYRLFGVNANATYKGSVTSAAPLAAGVTPWSARLDHVLNHAAIIGLRYSFNTLQPRGT